MSDSKKDEDGNKEISKDNDKTIKNGNEVDDAPVINTQKIAKHSSEAWKTTKETTTGWANSFGGWLKNVTSKETPPKPDDENKKE